MAAAGEKIKRICDMVYEEAKELIEDFHRFYIALYDSSNLTISFPLVMDNDQCLAYEPRSFIESCLPDFSISNRQTIITNHSILSEKGGAKGYKYWPENEDLPVSMICSPMLIRDKAVGALVLEKRSGREELTTRSARLLDEIAQQSAVSIDRVYLHERLEGKVRHRTKDYQQLIDPENDPELLRSRIGGSSTKTANAVSGYHNTRELLNHLSDIAIKTLHAENCSIFIEDKENEPGIIKCLAGSGGAKNIAGIAKYQIGKGFTGNIAKTGKIYHLRNKQDIKKRVEFDQIKLQADEDSFRNLLAVPVKIKDAILGVIKVENKSENTSFTDEDLAVIEIIAEITAQHIENIKSYQELKTVSSKISHRIHNQITNYDGIAFDLQDETYVANLDRESLDMLSKRLIQTTSHLKRITNEFSHYNKPIQLKKGLYDINRLIQDEVHRAKSPPEIKIDIQNGLDIPAFSLDAGRISECIKELVHNAIRTFNESERTGTITIATELVRIIDKKESVRIIVEDDGPGIPDDSTVFTPFYSTNLQRTGLGLSTVKELVEAHNGTIQLIKKDKGACFEINIPVERGEQ